MAGHLIREALLNENRRRFRRPLLLPTLIVAVVLMAILEAAVWDNTEWDAPTPGRFLLLPLVTAAAWFCVAYLWFTPRRTGDVMPEADAHEQRMGRRLALVPGAMACVMGLLFALFALLYVLMAPPMIATH